MRNFELLEKQDTIDFQKKLTIRKREKIFGIALMIIAVTICLSIHKINEGKTTLPPSIEEEIEYQRVINEAIESKSLSALNTVYAELKETELKQKSMEKYIEEINANPVYKGKRLLFSYTKDRILDAVKLNLFTEQGKLRKAVEETKKTLRIFGKGFDFSHKGKKTTPQNENLADEFSNMFSSLIGKTNKIFDNFEKFAFGDSFKTSDDKSTEEGGSSGFNPFKSIGSLFEGLFNKMDNLTNGTNLTVYKGKIMDGSKEIGKFVGAIFGEFARGLGKGVKEGWKGKDETPKVTTKASSNTDPATDAQGDYNIKEFELKKLGLNMAPWTLHSARVLKEYFPNNDHLALVDLNRLMIQNPKKAVSLIKDVYNGKSGESEFGHFFNELKGMSNGESHEARVLSEFRKTLDSACREFLSVADKKK